jgi:cyclic pyranopterin phosphate synthase
LSLFKEIGLNKINLSLDSLDQEKFKHITRRDHFQKVMENLQLLLENAFEVKLNVVLMKGFNEDEILDFIEFTKDKNVSVRFIEFMPFDGNNWNSDKMVSLAEILEQANSRYGSDLIRLNDDAHDTTKNYGIKGYKGTWGVISTVTSPFCNSCNRMRLTADGKMKNCLFDNNEMDLLTKHRNGESVAPFIKMAVWDKHAVRGGMDTQEKFSDETLNQENRSMIAIGG